MTQSYQEVLVSSIGDFGRVQGLIVLACKLPEFIGAWSMIFMSFGGAQPDWWKITHQFNETSKLSATCSIVQKTFIFVKLFTNLEQKIYKFFLIFWPICRGFFLFLQLYSKFAFFEHLDDITLIFLQLLKTFFKRSKINLHLKLVIYRFYNISVFF